MYMYILKLSKTFLFRNLLDLFRTFLMPRTLTQLDAKNSHPTKTRITVRNPWDSKMGAQALPTVLATIVNIFRTTYPAQLSFENLICN